MLHNQPFIDLLEDGYHLVVELLNTHRIQELQNVHCEFFLLQDRKQLNEAGFEDVQVVYVLIGSHRNGEQTIDRNVQRIVVKHGAKDFKFMLKGLLIFGEVQYDSLDDDAYQDLNLKLLPYKRDGLEEFYHFFVVFFRFLRLL